MSNTDEKFVHKYVSIEPLNKKFLKVTLKEDEKHWEEFLDESLEYSKEHRCWVLIHSEIKDFIINEEYLNYNGIIDFVSNGHITLNELKKHYKSESKFGDYHYNSNYEYTNPIYKLDLKYDKTSFEKLKIYENE